MRSHYFSYRIWDADSFYPRSYSERGDDRPFPSYQKNDDGTPKKEHNYAEFQLLHQLSTIQISGATFAQVLIAAFLATFCVLSTCPVYPDHLRPVLGKFRFVRHHLSFLIINDGTKIYLSLHLAARP